VPIGKCKAGEGEMFEEEEVAAQSEREFFIDNLLVRIDLIIEMILVDRPCAMGLQDGRGRDVRRGRDAGARTI